MKIVDACRITGRGEALITDEAFSAHEFLSLRSKKKARVSLEDGDVVFDVIGAEAVLRSGGREYLGFLVPFFPEESLRRSVVGQTIHVY